ncbi:hypothetical protein [Actinokineospora sp. NBRC 105648]|uniref:hypothetical protein n=1 Tax=Actinokineospora sp. NBRC 105648 TaxID=3032206 RepID=UPI0024A13DCE|nr:hypothetical protein [Actinokineospora sp. NBRC 105648]GLZ43192.1 hypothetical protein Acsp05_68160 [Actinokineospora sp. NBRC 105648]
MKLYADHPVRWSRQVVADVAAVLLVLLAIWLASEVRDTVLLLRAPGDGLVNAGNALRGTFDSAAAKADDVPLVGDSLAEALRSGADAGNRLSGAGQQQIAAVEDLAFWLTVVLIAVPVALLLITWLPLRLHYVRQASGAERLRRLGAEGHDVLALRALMTQPLGRLARSRDVGAGWRAADPGAIEALASLELRRLGLRRL